MALYRNTYRSMYTMQRWLYRVLLVKLTELSPGRYWTYLRDKLIMMMIMMMMMMMMEDWQSIVTLIYHLSITGVTEIDGRCPNSWHSITPLLPIPTHVHLFTQRQAAAFSDVWHAMEVFLWSPCFNLSLLSSDLFLCFIILIFIFVLLIDVTFDIITS